MLLYSAWEKCVSNESYCVFFCHAKMSNFDSKINSGVKTNVKHKRKYFLLDLNDFFYQNKGIINIIETAAWLKIKIHTNRGPKLI